MSRPKEDSVPRITTIQDLPLITDTTAKEVARFFLSRNNGHQRFVLEHEPDMFSWTDANNCTKATRPDLKITDLQNGKEFYLEVTTNEIRSETRRAHVGRRDDSGKEVFEEREETILVDPKCRQKEVMANAALATKYVVWYRPQLEAVQNANPGFNFFNGRDWKNVKRRTSNGK